MTCGAWSRGCARLWAPPSPLGGGPETPSGAGQAGVPQGRVAVAFPTPNHWALRRVPTSPAWARLETHRGAGSALPRPATPWACISGIPSKDSEGNFPDRQTDRLTPQTAPARAQMFASGWQCREPAQAHDFAVRGRLVPEPRRGPPGHAGAGEAGKRAGWGLSGSRGRVSEPTLARGDRTVPAPLQPPSRGRSGSQRAGAVSAGSASAGATRLQASLLCSCWLVTSPAGPGALRGRGLYHPCPHCPSRHPAPRGAPEGTNTCREERRDRSLE